VEFARSGASVVVNGRDQKVVDAAVAKMTAELGTAKPAGAKFYSIAADVATAAGCKTLMEKVDAIAPLDVLICNVSIFKAKEFTAIDDDEWLNYFNVNIMSCVRLCRSYLPQMIKRNAHGRVVIISSECGLRPLPSMIAYAMTKGSQINLARGLAELTHGTTVTVNSLLPGPTATEGLEPYLKTRLQLENAKRPAGSQLTFEEFQANYMRLTEPSSIIERYIEPVEVAYATLFLCTISAGVINGNAQRVEGGIVRHL